jgi:hypothetical protein
MKAITIVMLFTVVLTGSAFAADEKKGDVSLSSSRQFSVENGSQKWNRHNPSLNLSGVSQFASWATRKDIVVIAPEDQTSQVEARLTFGPGSFANLYTKEKWAAYDGMVREMNWTLVIGRDGKVTTSFPRHATYYYGPDFTIPSEEDHNTIATHAEMTGCPEYGTWPIYHGHFDGKLLDIATEQQGVCTGGTYWKEAYGVSEDMGPLHTDIILSLEVTE